MSIEVGTKDTRTVMAMKDMMRWSWPLAVSLLVGTTGGCDTSTKDETIDDQAMGSTGSAGTSSTGMADSTSSTTMEQGQTGATTGGVSLPCSERTTPEECAHADDYADFFCGWIEPLAVTIAEDGTCEFSEAKGFCEDRDANEGGCDYGPDLYYYKPLEDGTFLIAEGGECGYLGDFQRCPSVTEMDLPESPACQCFDQLDGDR